MLEHHDNINDRDVIIEKNMNDYQLENGDVEQLYLSKKCYEWLHQMLQLTAQNKNELQ